MAEALELLQTIPALHPLGAAGLRRLAACAEVAAFAPGAALLREGEPASRFHLLISGHVALESRTPGRPPRVVATLGRGDLLGASWLAPPFRWALDARALEPSTSVAVDVAALRAASDADPGFGLALMRVIASMLAQRLHACRMHLLDVYAQP